MLPIFKAQATKAEKEVTGHLSTLKVLSHRGTREIPVIHCKIEINDFGTIFCDEIYEIDPHTLKMSTDGGKNFHEFQ